MANYGDFKGALDKIISTLRGIERHTGCASCGSTNTTTAGTGSVPAGLKSVAIVKTSSNADTVILTLSDASTYTMTEQGEVFVQAASGNGSLPTYVKSGAGTIKWHGIK